MRKVGLVAAVLTLVGCGLVTPGGYPGWGSQVQPGAK